jgi:hypothetical protein
MILPRCMDGKVRLDHIHLNSYISTIRRGARLSSEVSNYGLFILFFHHIKKV